ncbi:MULTISPECIES: glycine/proline betaine ABC transporter ATP-binding protein OpuAA [Bacillus]|jgi:glycine betaine/proline transport system ATP-binding protein|uniref:Quaternary amine transport ATP-binding protein n=1 Tax=Bacillus amyloliquefaciens (strain ATCC 23350 / DSM 7 / BCRC 11601 / CCUG 28519 / NBRC 15535 / NRRL B-14393 / F) TaxID=692420 RepID=A0A9P1NGL0_BACAS|nr:glycine/proline betaine ABC transporter ATP-binding protein OpuAA [Bacillus amyloliquefaciens]ARW37438.1 Quaternary-amine-transporting ATPase [Bacillus amyloliquefaciens]AZV91692.1 glycine/betaine ABC transporter ATP-binding protein [Bacillus amyloliquefaciens]KYC97004.1 Glycine betaine ABC transport system, ATP-binding protein OpuAA [Bacillus amyloliquefaciens]MBW8280886.1 glycine/proline betaine ABC transporter ATP-binding protein OpuAA [Bacillus amyloliquefaciens]MDR4378069.1 glycine bet
MNSDEKPIKIKVENVSKVFGKQTKKAIQMLSSGKNKKEILKATGSTVGVNQANFDVYDGEIFVIMGLSGSGKSTLVRLLNRLIEPTAGNIYIDGDMITNMSKDQLREVRRKKISMVFQKFALFPHRTILENTEYGLELQGVDKKEREKKALDSLKLVGLEGFEHQFPDQLSGGMQQRVGLARALTNDPDILLMDEAFSALDPLIRKDMQDELLDLHDSVGKTIIFITHDLDEALRIGDRIVLMKDGNIVQIGTPEEILMSPSNEYVEKFVEDVDLSKVLTAGHIMKRAETVRIDKGPRVALQLMKNLGISSIYAVDKQKKLLGVIHAADAKKAVESDLSLQDILNTEFTTVHESTYLTEIFDVVSDANIPIAVTDDKGRMKGIVVKGALIGALSGNNDYINVEDSAEQAQDSSVQGVK